MSTVPQSTTCRVPAIGEYVRGHGTLVAVQPTPPPPPPPPINDYIFEAVTAHCEVLVNGDLLKVFNEVWDFYGKEASVADAVAAAKKYAITHKIGKQSDVEVRAVRTTTQTRKRASDVENLYDKRFFNFEPLAQGAFRDLPGFAGAVVWSSRHDDPSESTAHSGA